MFGGGAFQEMVQMIHEMEFNSIEHMLPKRIYSEQQLLLLKRITKLSGIKFINDPRQAYMNLGRQFLNVKGVYGVLNNDVKRSSFITMNENPQSPYWWSVLFHELSHATGALVFNRPTVLTPNRQKTLMQVAYEEMLAETSANLIMRYFGLNTPETDLMNHSYVANNFNNAIAKGFPMDADYAQGALMNEAKIVSDYIINNWLIDLDVKKESRLIDSFFEFFKYF